MWLKTWVYFQKTWFPGLECISASWAWNLNRLLKVETSRCVSHHCSEVNWGQQQTGRRWGQRSTGTLEIPNRDKTVTRIPQKKKFCISANENKYAALGVSLGMPLVWVAVTLLWTLMITSCMNGCSHGFVALCNGNSDPTVIHWLFTFQKISSYWNRGEGRAGVKVDSHAPYLCRTNTLTPHPGPTLSQQSRTVQYGGFTLCYQSKP